MPELSLSLYLHLHHSVVGVLYTLQGFLNSWKQVNDLLFADQDLTVGKSQHGADVNIQHCGSLKYQMSRERLKRISPRVLDSYLRCVYRSLRTLSWFWTVWMMAFTISELSLLTSGSGAEREDKINCWSHTLHSFPPKIQIHLLKWCHDSISWTFLTFTFHLQLLVELNRLFFTAMKSISHILRVLTSRQHNTCQ